MDHADLGLKLKQFHLLESFQVQLFETMRQGLDQEHFRQALETMIERERYHTELIGEQLHRYGFDLPKPADALSELAGGVSAGAVNLMPPAERFKAGARLEREAIRMYNAFIGSGDDGDLKDALWHNLVDEEFHRYWFEAMAEKLGSEATKEKPAHV